MNESKILIHNIFHMLCYAFHILRQSNFKDIQSEEFNHVDDLLAAILSKGISAQLKKGLTKTYIEHRDQMKTLRGKLHAYETKKMRIIKKQQVDCSFDELSEDNELNQIIKTTAQKLVVCPEVSLKYRKSLRKELMFFNTVSDIDISSVKWGRLQYHRNNKSYELLMNICYFVWQSLLPSKAPGKKKFTLFEEEGLPRLYEKFILEYYRQHFPMLRANDSAIRWDLPEDLTPYSVAQLPGMHSDIMLRYGSKTLIIDAKFYKKSLADFMEKRMLVSNNIYQIYAYVKNEDKKHTGNVSGMLLYAKTTEEILPSLSVPIGGNLISARSMDLNREFGEISYALDEIVRTTFGEGLVRVA